MDYAVAMVVGVWAFATFAVAAAAGLFPERKDPLPQTRHPRTPVADLDI